MRQHLLDISPRTKANDQFARAKRSLVARGRFTPRFSAELSKLLVTPRQCRTSRRHGVEHLVESTSVLCTPYQEGGGIVVADAVTIIGHKSLLLVCAVDCTQTLR